MARGTEFEKPIHREGDGRYLSRVLTGVRHRFQERLTLEEANIPIHNTPIGGEEGTQDILEFWAKVQDGFRLCFRSDQDTRFPLDEEKLLAATTSNDEVDSLLQIIGWGVKQNFSTRLERIDNKHILPAFSQTVATFAYLRQKGEVSLAALQSPDAHKVGRIALYTTFWGNDITTEYIHAEILRLHEATIRGIWATGKVAHEPGFMRAIHFYAASEHLAQAIKAA